MRPLHKLADRYRRDILKELYGPPKGASAMGWPVRLGAPTISRLSHAADGKIEVFIAAPFESSSTTTAYDVFVNGKHTLRKPGRPAYVKTPVDDIRETVRIEVMAIDEKNKLRSDRSLPIDFSADSDPVGPT